MALFPKSADNTYTGKAAALWLMGAILVLRIGVSGGTIFNGRNAAINADGIPLGTYSPAAVQTVLAIFAMLGVARFMTSLVCAVILWRYRALLGAAFAMLFLEQACRQLVLWAIPIERTPDAPGIAINAALLLAMLAGLGLTQWPRSTAANR